MTALSILYQRSADANLAAQQPDCFADLNLDQVVAALTASASDDALARWFWSPLTDPDTICYRQEVMQDIAEHAMQEPLMNVAEQIRAVHRALALAATLDIPHHRAGWFLEAALRYADTAQALARYLASVPLRARALLNVRSYLDELVNSGAFQDFVAEARQVKQALAAITYCVIIEAGRLKVKRWEGETDYSMEIEAAFVRFRQHDVPDYLVKPPERSGMSHIEAKILEFVARLYPEPFAALDNFCERYQQFLDPTIALFEQEIQFYLTYLALMTRLARRGLPFCYPEISTTTKAVSIRGGFDLALAHHDSEHPIVLNDCALADPERIVVVTGPNQGGKTTYARMIGQLHYLARLGLPVPARAARLWLCDHIFTHFERGENTANWRSKLENDLIRIHDMMKAGTPNSLFILNEIFNSTTFRDALFLSRAIMQRLIDLDALAVWVTFLDELSVFGPTTVSMAATVDPVEPTKRTFTILRQPASGLAYALSLAEKHGLTYQQIIERLP